MSPFCDMLSILSEKYQTVRGNWSFWDAIGFQVRHCLWLVPFHSYSLTLTPDHPHWGPLSPFSKIVPQENLTDKLDWLNLLALPLNSPRVREVSTCVAYVINTVVGICLPLSQPLTLSFLLYPWVVHLTSSSNSSSSISSSIIISSSSSSSSQWTEWTCRQQATGGTDSWLGIPRYWGSVILCGKTRPNTESFTHGQHAHRTHSPPPVPHPQAALIQLVVSISQISLVSKPELRKVTSTGQGKEIFCNSVVNIFAA